MEGTYPVYRIYTRRVFSLSTVLHVWEIHMKSEHIDIGV